MLELGLKKKEEGHTNTGRGINKHKGIEIGIQNNMIKKIILLYYCGTLIGEEVMGGKRAGQVGNEEIVDILLFMQR